MSRRDFVRAGLYVAAASTAAFSSAFQLRGLTSAERERALRLHRNSVVINCHDHMWRAQDYQEMRRGGVSAKIYKPLADGIYWDDQNRRTFPADPFDWRAKYLEVVERVERLERRAEFGVRIVRRLADIQRAKSESKAAVILGNEGTLPLAENIKNLDLLYQRGLRELALYWPAGGHTAHVVDSKGFLTPFAQQVIARANELGIVLDPSHLAAAPAFRQVLELSSAPVIHTHGAPRFPRTRRFGEGDLEHEQIRAIASRGGVIGLHFCTYIKNPNGLNWSPTLDDLMDHVQYIVNAGGIECLGIGADHFPYNRRPLAKPFDEAGGAKLEDMDWSKTFVVGLESISGMPLFTQGLVQRRFSDADIQKILGGNAMRVFRAAWKQ